MLRRPFKLVALVLAFASHPFAGAFAQSCQGAYAGRVALIAGGFAAVQGTAVALRHDDWWPGPSQNFSVVWDDVSPSKEQDRLLHAAIAYQISQGGALAWDWACVPRITAGWLGAALGVAFSLPKEIGDGFEEGKGFSAPDMIWSTAGAILPALHRSFAPSRALTLKVFYWPSQEFRDSGDALPSIENDYAGQRFYLTLNPGRFPGGGVPWPDWLGIAVGHSVPHWISVRPVHEWYVTLDFDFRGLPIENGGWKNFASVLDQVHFPMPGVRVREGEMAFGVF
jgi:uncharacterized protein YfiM (DUF2279 family)